MGDLFILAAARTPIGKFGGALRDVHPAELGAVAARACLERARIPAEAVDEVIIGHARQAGSGPNPARQIVRRARLADDVPAQTVNRACASGMQAIVSAAQTILARDAELIVAGGIESMSRMPYLIDAMDARWGRRLGPMPLVDAMYRDGFTCPLSDLVMGETVERLASQYGIGRESSDEFAFSSQQKTADAVARNRFAEEIAPVVVKNRGRTARTVAADEHPRPDTTLSSLAALPPVFAGEDGAPGIITAGSASGITDGGAAVVVASAGRAREIEVPPLARLIGWSVAAIDPRMMGIGPVPAVKRLLARTGLRLDDFDLIEINEAFAPQVLAVMRDLDAPDDRVNVNGGAIALGHPIGASGARIVVTLLHEMRRRGARRGLATLCVSGGMGMALAMESA